MAAVKSQVEQASWLDNSFMSVDMKSVDTSHPAKRSRCSALPLGKRKTAKRQCSMQKDHAKNISVDTLQQEFTVECNDEVFTDLKRTVADENKNTMNVSQLCPPCASYIITSVADGGSDEVNSFSKQDQSTTSLVFIKVFFC